MRTPKEVRRYDRYIQAIYPDGSHKEWRLHNTPIEIWQYMDIYGYTKTQRGQADVFSNIKEENNGQTDK